MKFDYVEIGTSDFDTCLNVVKENEKALLVEPLFHYLANLPNPHNIIKAPFAVSDTSGYSSVFYVDREDIQRYGLPEWVAGCNSFGSPHRTIMTQFPTIRQKERFVPVITFQQLLDLYHISEIENLIIDTEGHDHVILGQVMNWVDMLKIRTIKIEYIPSFGNILELDKLIENLESQGFFKQKDGHDMLLVKQ